MKLLLEEEKGFFTIIGVLLALCLIAYLMVTAFKTYYKSPALESITEEGKPKSEQVIDTSNYRSVLESSKSTIDKYNQDIMKREQHYSDFDQEFKK